jgi:hypothetical protein
MYRGLLIITGLLLLFLLLLLLLQRLIEYMYTGLLMI